MFPNDDICNTDAARNAAKRLFSRYKGQNEREEEMLGKN